MSRTRKNRHSGAQQSQKVLSIEEGGQDNSKAQRKISVNHIPEKRVTSIAKLNTKSQYEGAREMGPQVSLLSLSRDLNPRSDPYQQCWG